MKKFLLYSSVAMLFFSCSKDHFKSLLQDPNRPTSVHPSLLLAGIEVTAFTAQGCPPSYLAHMQCNAAGAKAEEYFTFDRGGFGGYDNLLQVEQMRQEAVSRALPEYTAISEFFRSFYLYQLTMTFGDVPDSQALGAVKGIYSPAYDTQKDVFKGLLNDLEEANAILQASTGANANPVTGDVIYNGDLLKWRKLINSFRLRVLMTLSSKSGDMDLNIVQQFGKIVGDPTDYPLFQRNEDDAMLTYTNIANNRYPLYQATDEQRTYLDKKFGDFLVNTSDPRLFSFASITANAKAAGKATTDFTAYGGADASMPYANLAALVIGGTVSQMNARYIFDPVNEPHVAVGYPELQFNLAEAAFRGWINGDPETYYKSGIKASLDFYAPYGNYNTDDYFTALYANPAVQYTAGQELQDILQQKYICFYMNSDDEAWYNLRRTGLPVLKLDGGGVQNGGKLPLRYMYPQTEINTNSTNLNAAISRQFPNGDNINGVMWLLQP